MCSNIISFLILNFIVVTNRKVYKGEIYTIKCGFMAYIVIITPESEKAQRAIGNIKKIHGDKVLADVFLRDFSMNTKESGLAQVVGITFELMTEEQRDRWLGSADAYRIVNNEISLDNPTYRGKRTQP